MKKRYIYAALLAACLTLCTACGKDTQPDTASDGNRSGLSSASEAPKIEYHPTEALFIEMEQKFRAEFPGKCIPVDDQPLLAANGITAEVSDLFLISDTQFLFTLTLHKGSETAEIAQVPGEYAFDYMEGNIVNVSYNWGHVTALETAIAVTTRNEIMLYDTETLKPLTLTLDMDELSQKEYCLAGLGYDFSVGYFAPAEVNGSDAFIFWDQQGAFKEIQYFEGSQFTDSNLIANYPVNKPEYGRTWTSPVSNLHVVSVPDPIITFQGVYYAYFYDPTKAELLGAGNQYLDYKEDSVAIEAYSIGDYNGTIANITGKKRDLALCYIDQTLDSYIRFDGSEINIDYEYDEETGQDNPALYYTWNEQAKTLYASCPLTDQNITANFSSGSISWSYQIDPAHVITEYEMLSPDGGYVVRRSSERGGGDYYGYNLVLEDVNAQTYSFIAYAGGMYGPSYELGFFGEQELYYCDRVTTRFIDTATGKPSGRVLKFPLGEDVVPGKQRWLLSFAYDGDGYVITYIDYDRKAEASDASEEELLCEYQIALLDGSGAVTSTFSTGIRCRYDFFGLKRLYTKKNGDKLAFVVNDNRSVEPIEEGVVDLSTQKFVSVENETQETENPA